MRPTLKPLGVCCAAILLLGFIPAPRVTGSVRGSGRPDEGNPTDKSEPAVAEALGKELHAATKKAMDSGKIEGLIHVVGLDGKTVYQEVAGHSDVAAKKPLRADAIIRIYSMSKPLTSVAAMTLYEKGKFKFDDPVARYIPAFKDTRVLEGKGDKTKLVKPKRPITVRDLFRHTSGYSYGNEAEVKKYYEKEGVTGWGKQGMYPPKMTIEKLADALARIPTLHHPGERFTYGYNTDVLGRLIEVWSGKPLDQYLKKAVFEPLGMVDTGFSVPKEKRHRLAATHSTEDGKLVVIDPAAKSAFAEGLVCLSGGGGLLSTAADYSRFCQMIIGGGQLDGKRVLKAATVALMLENQLKEVAGPFRFGLGFAINKVKVGKGAGRKVLEYSWGGYASTSFKIVPALKLYQIVLRQHIPPQFPLNEQLIRQVYAGITLPPDKPAVPGDVTFRRADIMSEGTRMAAEVFAPKKPKSDKLPTIVMSHGWGGTAKALRPDAIAFARAGFLVITFDYRGWGNSDSRLILVGKKPVHKDGKLIAEVKEVREVVDPLDQTTDILNAIHWVVGEKQCDSERIGLWGSSYSGGHVVHVAARDKRVKAFVSQVPSLDSRRVIKAAAIRKFTYGQGTARTRGKIGYPQSCREVRPPHGHPVDREAGGLRADRGHRPVQGLRETVHHRREGRTDGQQGARDPGPRACHGDKETRNDQGDHPLRHLQRGPRPGAEGSHRLVRQAPVAMEKYRVNLGSSRAASGRSAPKGGGCGAGLGPESPARRDQDRTIFNKRLPPSALTSRAWRRRSPSGRLDEVPLGRR